MSNGRSVIVASVSLALSASFLGCAQRSHELRLGETATFETLEPVAGEPFGEQPSLMGLDRTHWPTTTVMVPVDDVGPLEAASLPIPESGADHRVARRFPTPEESVELGTPSSLASAEGLVAPFASAFDLVSLPVRWIAGAPWDWNGRPVNWRDRSPAAAVSEPAP